MELGAHDVVVVAGEHADALPTLPVPDPHRLVVGGGQDPGVLVVEHGRPDVVKMAQQGEDAPPLLVIPDLENRSLKIFNIIVGFYLDLVVISSRDKEGLLLVEVHTPDWPVVLVKLVQESAHPGRDETCLRYHK